MAGDNCLLILDAGNFRLRKMEAGVITTLAGNGTAGYSGDGGPATAAQISEAQGLWYDPATKNIFIADTGNNVVRRVDPGGIITTVAGTGTPGYSGDGGPAAAAQLHGPQAVTTTASGYLYISEGPNHRIRKVDPTGIITTATGDGTKGFTGDALMLGPSARLRQAKGMTSFQNAVYFTDMENNRLRVLKLNLPPAINDVLQSQNPIKINSPVTFTALATDSDSDTMTYSWDPGDGSGQISDNPAVHTFTTEGVYTGTLTVADPWQSVSDTGTITVVAPNSGGAGVTNVAQGNANVAKVANPLNGLTIEVVSSDGGVIELYIDVNALIREAYSVATDFECIQGRVATVNGTRPVHKFTDSGIDVAVSTATENATGQQKGKARKMLVISKREVGQTAPVNDNRTSTDIAMSKMKGKFNFTSGLTRLVSGLSATAAKVDTVAFSGKIHLPGGLDIAQEQDLWIGIGNIVDHLGLGAKGKPKLPSDKGYLKKFRIKYPKLVGTVTAGDETAQVDFTVSLLDMSTAGFDTEGISVEVSNADKTPVTRQIQVGMLLSGVAYQSSATTLFKTKLDRTTKTPVRGELTGMSRTGR
jgi:PKD repeat protein